MNARCVGLDTVGIAAELGGAHSNQVGWAQTESKQRVKKERLSRDFLGQTAKEARQCKMQLLVNNYIRVQQISQQPCRACSAIYVARATQYNMLRVQRNIELSLE